MPRRSTTTKQGTHQALRNTSYEMKVVSWLMADGWQVFTPVLDNGHATDILISDGPRFYRVQIKTVSGDSEDQWVENKWKDNPIDVVIYFARKSDWGYVAPAFTTKRKRLNAEGHLKFKDNRREFLKAFHKID